MRTKTELDAVVTGQPGGTSNGTKRRKCCAYSCGREGGHGIMVDDKEQRGVEQVVRYEAAVAIPQAAAPTKLTAPVHVDIGGTTYTTTLQQLTKYKHSKLAKLFDGTELITIDTMKQHYFIDRDGPAFRHILNFLRYGELVLPADYTELDILKKEAEYYNITPLIHSITQYRTHVCVDTTVKDNCI